MIKMKNLWSLLAILMVVMVSFSLSSCGDDDGGGSGSGLKGWYTNLSDVAKQSDFNKLNEAINNDEVLSSYRYGGQTHTYVASRDLFISSDGMYSDSDAHFGRLRFSIQTPINAIRIVDDQTLVFYVAWLYEDGASSDDVVYKLYAGSIFGYMTYYGSGSYYTYAKVENKIVVSNGDIYTVVDGGLIKDGSSAKWSKYDPNIINGNAGSDNNNNNNGNNNKNNDNNGNDNKTEAPKGTANGHIWIDLGLPSGTKWATMNIDALTEYKSGGYYSWGEIQTKSSYDWTDYKYANCKSEYDYKMTKYCTRSSYGTVDNLTTLQLSDDVAYKKWGTSWKIPSVEQFQELLSFCTITQHNDDNGSYAKIIGPNGGVLILPLAGWHYMGSELNAPNNGNYWTRNLSTDYDSGAINLWIWYKECTLSNTYRNCGMTIRPVLSE